MLNLEGNKEKKIETFIVSQSFSVPKMITNKKNYKSSHLNLVQNKVKERDNRREKTMKKKRKKKEIDIWIRFINSCPVKEAEEEDNSIEAGRSANRGRRGDGNPRYCFQTFGETKGQVFCFLDYPIHRM